MSTIPEELGTEAYHWIVQRPDGAGFAATSHDRQSMAGAMALEPNVDLRPRTLALNDQLFGSSLDLDGGLGSPALSPADLLAGRWQRVSLQLLMGDWSNSTEQCLLAAGELGRTANQDGNLTTSVDLLPVAARQTCCVQTSPECRAILGDQQCRVDMRSRRLRVTMSGVEPDGIVVGVTDHSRFALGRLRWVSGAQCGQEDMIIAVDGGRLVLRDAARSSLKIGDRAILFEGCDGRRATCSERFGNMANFRGEPDLPGSEILLRFPGA